MSPVRVESSINSSSWFDRQPHQAVLKSEYATNALNNCKPALINQLSQCVVQLGRDEQRFTPEEKTLIQLAAGYKLQQLFLEKKTQEAACLEQKQRTLTVLMTRYDAMKKQAGGSSLIEKNKEINTLCKELAPIAPLDKKNHEDIKRLETDIGIDLKKYQPDIPATISKLEKISEKIHTLDVYDPLFDKKTREILKESLPVLAQVSSIIFLSTLYTHSFENFSASIGKVMPEHSASTDSDRAGEDAKYEEYISLTEQSFAQIPALYEAFVEFRNVLEKKDAELKAGKKFSPREQEKYKKDLYAGDHDIVVKNSNNDALDAEKKIGQFAIKPLKSNQKSIHEIIQNHEKIQGEKNTSGLPSTPNRHIEEDEFPVEIIHGTTIHEAIALAQSNLEEKEKPPSKKWNDSAPSFRSKKGSSVNIKTAIANYNNQPWRDMNSPTGFMIRDEANFLSPSPATSPNQENANLLSEKLRKSEEENLRLVDDIERIAAELVQFKEQKAMLLNLRSENELLKSTIYNLEDSQKNEMQKIKKERDENEKKYFDEKRKFMSLNDISENKDIEINRLSDELEKLKAKGIVDNKRISSIKEDKLNLEKFVYTLEENIYKLEKGNKRLEERKKYLKEKKEELKEIISDQDAYIRLIQSNHQGSQGIPKNKPEKIRPSSSQDSFHSSNKKEFLQLIKEFDEETIVRCLKKSFGYDDEIDEQGNIGRSIFKMHSSEKDFALRVCLNSVGKFRKNTESGFEKFLKNFYDEPLSIKNLLEDHSLKNRSITNFGELESIDYELMRYIFLSIQDYYDASEANKKNKGRSNAQFFLHGKYTLQDICSIAGGLDQGLYGGADTETDMSMDHSFGTDTANTSMNIDLNRLTGSGLVLKGPNSFSRPNLNRGRKGRP